MTPGVADAAPDAGRIAALIAVHAGMAQAVVAVFVPAHARAPAAHHPRADPVKVLIAAPGGTVARNVAAADPVLIAVLIGIIVPSRRPCRKSWSALWWMKKARTSWLVKSA